MNGVRYTLRLLEPVLANSLAGDANSAQTVPYIPGGLVRGALAGRWLRGQSLAPDSDDEATFRRLFVRPATRYLHAYPMTEGERALPAPLSWNSEKHADETAPTVYDLAFEEPERDGEPLDDLRPVGFRFYRRPGGDKVYHHSLGRQVYVHTQRDAVLGRADKERGAVYRYESLPAGSWWIGAILTETAEDTATLKKLLEELGDVALGKARSAGYGRVRFETIEELDEWEEAPDIDALITHRSEDDHDAGPTRLSPPDTLSEFRLVCLSPLLTRDKNGQPGSDPAHALGLRLGAKVSVKRAFRRPEVVGGFNRKWGTYLPQAVAAATGTVFHCHAETPIGWDKLTALSESGLGERRGEGFGRVAVKWMGTEELTAEKEDLQYPPPNQIPLSEADRALARWMLERMLRERLDAGVTRAANFQKLYSSRDNRPILPSPSQVSRWRVAIRNALAGLAAGDGEAVEQLAMIKAFASRERGRNSRAWQKMNRTRLVGGDGSGQRLTDWIEALLDGPQGEWRAIVGAETPHRLSLGEVTFEAGEAMRIEYMLRLIDAVLRHVRAEAKREDRP